LCGDWLVKHFIEGKTDTGKEVWRRRRRKQLQDDLTERRGYRKLKEEALDGIVWGISQRLWTICRTE